jgi:hypothetical protein
MASARQGGQKTEKNPLVGAAFSRDLAISTVNRSPFTVYDFNDFNDFSHALRSALCAMRTYTGYCDFTLRITGY